MWQDPQEIIEIEQDGSFCCINYSEWQKGSFENEALENEDPSPKHPNLENEDP